MKRNKVACEICGREISKSNIKKHVTSHETNPKYHKKKRIYALNHEGLVCQFCGKECKNRNSLCNHERLCKKNPNKMDSPFVDYHNSPDYVVWNKGLTKETDERVKKSGETLSKNVKVNRHDEDIDDDHKLYQKYLNKCVNAQKEGLQCLLTYEE